MTIPQNFKRKQVWLQYSVSYEEYINEAKSTTFALLLEQAPDLCNRISTVKYLSFMYAATASTFWISLFILFTISHTSSKIGSHLNSYTALLWFFFLMPWEAFLIHWLFRELSETKHKYNYFSLVKKYVNDFPSCQLPNTLKI